MKLTFSTLACGLLTATLGSLAFGQTSSSDHATAIGTSQQNADQASRKAVQDGSTASVVRTGPSAVERVHRARSNAGGQVARAKSKVKSKVAATTDAETNTTSTTNVRP